jgi:hypothetical protein
MRSTVNAKLSKIKVESVTFEIVTCFGACLGVG